MNGSGLDSLDEWVVSEAAEGMRLDKFLLLQRPNLGRAAAARWIAEGCVRVDGRRVAKAHPLDVGQLVQLVSALDERALAQVGAPLEVVYESPSVVVVEKPAGQPSVPLRAGELGTVANALLGRYPEMGEFGYSAREPGLIHRLDTFTSGLLVAARTAESFDRLRAALHERRLEKRYLAIVAADSLSPEPWVIRSALSWVAKSGRVEVVAELPEKQAQRSRRVQESRVKILEVKPPFALVEVEAKRAFRHQVRVHLASRNCPIVGDQLYGGSVRDALAGRHALHASHVAWSGDELVAGFSVDSELPGDLCDFWLRE